MAASLVILSMLVPVVPVPKVSLLRPSVGALGAVLSFVKVIDALAEVLPAMSVTWASTVCAPSLTVTVSLQLVPPSVLY